MSRSRKRLLICKALGSPESAFSGDLLLFECKTLNIVMLHLYLCSLEVCLSQTPEANWKNMLPPKSILELNANQRFSGTELLC